MESHHILYPAIAMFLLTIGTIFRLGLARYRAIHAGNVSIAYYRTYNEGDQPERLHLLGRHVQNHFEVPPLFHLGVLFAFVSETVSPTGIVLAWSYFALRCVHTYIHLGSNNVSRRFAVFGSSLLVLTGLWISVLVGLVQRTV